jgi:hypothetical protein
MYVSTSSTKAELLVASETAKMAPYICFMSDELGVPQEHATLMYEDNKGAHMTNAS